jgi:hypothetical protein
VSIQLFGGIPKRSLDVICFLLSSGLIVWYPKMIAPLNLFWTLIEDNRLLGISPKDKLFTCN